LVGLDVFQVEVTTKVVYDVLMDVIRRPSETPSDKSKLGPVEGSMGLWSTLPLHTAGPDAPDSHRSILEGGAWGAKPFPGRGDPRSNPRCSRRYPRCLEAAASGIRPR